MQDDDAKWESLKPWLPERESPRASPTPVAVGAFLDVLAWAVVQNTQPILAMSADSFLEALDGHLEVLIAREARLTVEDVEDLRALWISLADFVVHYTPSTD